MLSQSSIFQLTRPEAPDQNNHDASEEDVFERDINPNDVVIHANGNGAHQPAAAPQQARPNTSNPQPANPQERNNNASARPGAQIDRSVTHNPQGDRPANNPASEQPRANDDDLFNSEVFGNQQQQVNNDEEFDFDFESSDHNAENPANPNLGNFETNNRRPANGIQI